VFNDVAGQVEKRHEKAVSFGQSWTYTLMGHDRSGCWAIAVEESQGIAG
jgi:hypothetical protein